MDLLYGLPYNSVIITPQSLALLLFVSILSICAWRRYLSCLRDVPGPFLASFTRLWHIHRLLKGDQNLELIRLHDEHGYFIRIAPNEVSISHPDAIKMILHRPLRKGDWYGVVHFPDKRFKNPMGAVDPATKNELSRHLASGYSLSNMLQSEPAIDNTIGLLLDWFDQYAEKGTPIHLNDFFTYAALDIVGETVFSKPFGFLREGKDLGGTIANSLAHNMYVAIAGFVQWFHLLLANPVVTWLNLLPYGHVIDTTLSTIEERMKNPEARFDAMQHWLKYLADHPDRMDPREIQSAAANTIGAGSDTVACGLQGFVYHLIRRPDLWERARLEVEGTAGQDKRSVRVISYADAQDMPFLQACIKESLRIFSPAPMGLTRVAGKGGVTIGDRTFPEGTEVSVNAWVIHQSKEIWGPDAREFKPERWLQGDKSSALDKYYMPFGLGYMSCPGQHLAKMELSKICATIVRDYRIRQVDPNQQWKWKAYFTVAPHSWPCYVEKRQNIS